MDSIYSHLVYLSAWKSRTNNEAFLLLDLMIPGKCYQSSHTPVWGMHYSKNKLSLKRRKASKTQRYRKWIREKIRSLYYIWRCNLQGFKIAGISMKSSLYKYIPCNELLGCSPCATRTKELCFYMLHILWIWHGKAEMGCHWYLRRFTYLPSFSILKKSLP